MGIGYSILKERAEAAYLLLEECRVCPRECGINRLKNEKGHCRVGLKAMVSSFGPHFGEEPPLVGRFGSGTIFLTSCNLNCVFCQNYDISQYRYGEEVTEEEIARMMLALQGMGCHNINFVTPTHVAPQLMKAIMIAREQGLDIPIVYNCGGYESVEVLKLFEGIVDIYMPDFKYGDDEVAKELSNAPGYVGVAKKAIKEMHRQVGDLVVDARGVARRGLIIRHLVLPNNLAGTEKVMEFIANEISKHTYVNIMDQYRPVYRAANFPKITRRISQREFMEAVQIAKKFGLYRGFEEFI